MHARKAQVSTHKGTVLLTRKLLVSTVLLAHNNFHTYTTDVADLEMICSYSWAVHHTYRRSSGVAYKTLNSNTKTFSFELGGEYRS